MALKILSADAAIMTDPARRARIDEIKKILTESHWDFSGGGRRCALAGRTADVRAITDELIALLPKSQHAKAAKAKRALADLPESFLDEEHRRD